MAYDRQQIIRVVSNLLASGAMGAIVAVSVTATSGDFDTLDVGAGAVNDVHLETGLVSALVGALNLASAGAEGSLSLDDATVLLAASGAGDDATLAAADVATLRGGGLAGNNLVRCKNDGCDVQALDAGDGLVLAAAGTASVTAAGLVSVESTAGGLDLQSSGNSTYSSDGSITVSSAGGAGGVLLVNAAGMNLSAASFGDDITLTADGGITLDAEDVVTIDGASTVSIISDTARISADTVTRSLVSGGAQYRVPALLFAMTTAWEPVTTGEESALAFDIPSTAFSAGERTHITLSGEAAGNANAKTWRIRIGANGSGTGGSAMLTCNFSNALDTRLRIEADVWFSEGTGEFESSGVCIANARIVDTIRVAGVALATNAVIEVNVTLQNATAATDSNINAAFLHWY